MVARCCWPTNSADIVVVFDQAEMHSLKKDVPLVGAQVYCEPDVLASVPAYAQQHEQQALEIVPMQIVPKLTHEVVEPA